ncbi:hypothetical protein HHK36_015305 [Tetracentron sinense]|uniref:Uncharacterized protein n=1 Tax=Tetracentron sinense TaxID=13715 RepID=A0A834Z2U0_TETSI|nr:hypothetical protein HHK36_015305 [Tetracentron sinense]
MTKIQIEEGTRKNEDLLSIWNYDGTTAYEDIIKATEDLTSNIALELEVMVVFTEQSCLPRNKDEQENVTVERRNTEESREEEIAEKKQMLS